MQASFIAFIYLEKKYHYQKKLNTSTNEGWMTCETQDPNKKW